MAVVLRLSLSGGIYKVRMNYLEKLKKSGFIVTSREKSKELPLDLIERYKNIPDDYLDFLQQFTQITNKDNTVWFNSIEDYSGNTDAAFKWNEFESLSLEAFEGDEEETHNITVYWDNHIPVIVSVKTYEYLAICLGADNYGKIVHGEEPEFEESSVVCSSFEELVDLLTNSAENHILNHFL